MFFLPRSQLLGSLGALMYVGQAVQGIQLDLSDTSKTLPSPERSRHNCTRELAFNDC